MGGRILISHLSSSLSAKSLEGTMFGEGFFYMNYMKIGRMEHVSGSAQDCV